MARSTIQEYLGPPDDWHAATPDYHTSAIWKYGDIEFHFEQDTLWLIFLDDIAVPSGGSKIELDAWIISDRLSLDEAIQHLEAAGIDFREEAFPYTDNGVHLIISADIVLAFSGEDASQVTLYSLSHSRRSRWQK